MDHRAPALAGVQAGEYRGDALVEAQLGFSGAQGVLSGGG